MLDRFLQTFEAAFAAGQFVKCTLSKPTAAAPEGLKNVFLRPVEIKGQPKVAFNFRFKTRDEAKNFGPAEAIEKLRGWLGSQFLNADLFTAERDATLRFGSKGEPSLTFKKAANAAPADTRHDREKHRLLDPAAAWLHLLGITNARGEVLPTAQDKWRQINKFLEIVGPLAGQLSAAPHIADMGSGKGYLTFALFDFLKNRLGLAPQITGIELRPQLVKFCNDVAQQVGFQGLSFVADDINNFRPARLDLLIALHACDTATDLAIANGIRAGARAIVVAPCCHKQIRREMAAQNELAPVLRHGILEERQAEIVTDGIRALLLESEGYRTQVFEFISTEHTAKNVMITAVNGGRQSAADGSASQQHRLEMLAKVAALKSGFGIQTHFLETLLAVSPPPQPVEN